MHEFADTLLLVSKPGYKRIASDLVDMLTDTSFEMTVFKRYIKSLADSEDIFS